MDEFYIKYAERYRTLIERSEPVAVIHAQSSSRQAVGLTVCARIRPLFAEEALAGFPQAVFPLLDHNRIIDVHDLHHHPRWLTSLKVRR